MGLIVEIFTLWVLLLIVLVPIAIASGIGVLIYKWARKLWWEDKVEQTHYQETPEETEARKRAAQG